MSNANLLKRKMLLHKSFEGIFLCKTDVKYGIRFPSLIKLYDHIYIYAKGTSDSIISQRK